MEETTRIVGPGPSAECVTTKDGAVLKVPDGWVLLLPGDAGLTRRVKASGPSWTVQEKKGRRTFSRGVWAPRTDISSARTALAKERATEAYAKRRQSASLRREKEQSEYVCKFETAVFNFLEFAECYIELANSLAKAIAAHATPIGSGTVARTERIPIEQRAESAVIAWLRHQTTGYDDMKIAHVKGKRREVRRMLAERSRKMLALYRAGKFVRECPLTQALQGS